MIGDGKQEKAPDEFQNNEEKDIIALPRSILSTTTKGFLQNTQGSSQEVKEKNAHYKTLSAAEAMALRSSFVDEIFPSHLCQRFRDMPEELTQRSILCSTNEAVQAMNNIIIDKMNVSPQDMHNYVAINSVGTGDENKINEYTSEFLASLRPSGLPPNNITLAVGFPIMLLRNFDKARGLMNGTRLIVTRLGVHTIEARVAMGQHVGTKVILPKVKLITSDPSLLPVDYIRVQFPISVSFAMTINKAQGQTLPCVGLDVLEGNAFSHGQLYVALSRVKHPDHITVLSKSSYVRNVVIKEVL
jgi:hypothetical protein